MKTALIVSLAVVLALTGCAHMGEKSRAEHVRRHYAAIVPPGWNITTLEITNTASENELVAINFTAPGSITGGFWSNLDRPRPRVFCDWEERWQDNVSGGGAFLFCDPAATALSFTHTNQTALGGSRATSVGQIQSTITTNDVAFVNAAGTAIGNVVGAAISASTGGTTAAAGSAATATVNNATAK